MLPLCLLRSPPLRSACARHRSLFLRRWAGRGPSSGPSPRPRTVHAEGRPLRPARRGRRRPRLPARPIEVAAAIISLGTPSPTSSSPPPASIRGPRIRRPIVADRRSIEAACACTRWGLPCPVRHRNGRCALTTPFHPCLRPKSHRRFLFCGTFPDPQPTGRWVLPTTIVLSCSDFPRRLTDAIARSPFVV